MPSDTRVQGSLGHKAERRHSRLAATMLHGTESSADSKTVKQEVQESKGRGKIKPYCPYCEGSEHFLNKCQAIQKLSREEVVE